MYNMKLKGIITVKCLEESDILWMFYDVVILNVKKCLIWDVSNIGFSDCSSKISLHNQVIFWLFVFFYQYSNIIIKWKKHDIISHKT